MPRPKLLAATILLLVLACTPSTPRHENSRGSAPPATFKGIPSDSLLRTHELVDSLELELLGTEPFWNVVITRAGIVYRDPEHPSGIRFPYEIPSSVGTRLLISSSRRDSTPRAIRLSVEERECSDGMSDRQYRYASEVRLDSLDLHGCARFRPR